MVRPFKYTPLISEILFLDNETNFTRTVSMPKRLKTEVIFKTAKHSVKIPHASGPEVLVTKSKKKYPKNEPIILKTNAAELLLRSSFPLIFLIKLFNQIYFKVTKN